MSALMSRHARLVRTGERIVTGDDIYGGTSRLLAQVVPKVGIEVVNVDMNDPTRCGAPSTAGRPPW